MLKFRWETEFKKTEIGEIPKEWEVKRIKEIGEVAGGTTPSTKIKEYWDGNVPWLTPKDLRDYEYIYISKGERNITQKAVEKVSLKIFPKGTVLLTTRAPIGYVAIAKNPITTNQGFRNIISYKIKSEYLYYYLKNVTDYLTSLAGGSTFGELTGTTLKEVLVPYPPPTEQSRIATVLSWFDELIENKKRQNEILEKTAMAIFKSWFVDFEPFKDEEFVYNADLDREVPKGWEVKKLKEIANVIRGVSFNQKEASFEHFPNSVPILRANNIRTHMIIDFSNIMFIPARKISIEKCLQERDLVMVASNGNPKLVGKFSIYISPLEFKFFSFGSFMYCIRIKRSFDYVLAILNSDYFNRFLSSVVSGTNIINLNKSDLEEFKFPIPPQHILEKFHSLVEPLFQKIILNQKQIMVLRKIKDALLPQLVFGKLRVVKL